MGRATISHLINRSEPNVAHHGWVTFGKFFEMEKDFLTSSYKFMIFFSFFSFFFSLFFFFSFSFGTLLLHIIIIIHYVLLLLLLLFILPGIIIIKILIK
mgnify:CR=1 FL=1